MSLVRWSPLASSALSRWPSIWDDDELSTFMSQTANNLEVYETDDEVVVKANVAGVPTESVDVTFEKGVLWIKAEQTQESDDKQKKHYSKSSWSYSYKVAVPGQIDHGREPEALVKDGVLTISFKKAEASKPRKLTIKAK